MNLGILGYRPLSVWHMTTELTNLIESARKGDGKSIAALINRSLQSQGISAQAAIQDGYLKVMLEAETTPNQEFLVPYIQQGVTALHLPNLHTLQVFGRVKGTKQPDWTQLISLQPEVENQPAETANESNQPAEESQDANSSDIQQVEGKVGSSQADAIVEHLKQTIGSENITFLAELSETLLKITVKTDQLLEGDTFSKLIRESLLTLDLKDIASVQVYKQKTRGTSRYKIKEFTLVQEAPVVAEPEPEAPVEPSQASIRSTPRSRPTIAPIDSHPPKRLSKIARLVPLAIVTIVFLFATFSTLLSVAPSAAEQCRNSSAENNICRLAFQIAGEQSIADSKKAAIARTGQALQQSLDSCKGLAELAVEEDLEESSEPKANQSSFKAESGKVHDIFRGISLLEIYVTDPKTPESTVLRKACVVGYEKKGVQLLGADTIPNDWPQQPYIGHQAFDKINRSLKAHQIFIVLGGNILFTAVGLFFANMFNLGIRIFSLPILFQSAAVLGMVETTMFMVLRPGLFAVIPFSTVALLLTSFIVKDLKIDWSSGYRIVAMGVVTIIAARTLLNWLSLGLLFSIL